MEATFKSVGLTSVPTLVADAPSLKEKGELETEIPALANTKQFRKYVLLTVFCLGQFLDTLNTAAMFPAIPAISEDIGFTESDSVWLFAAYQTTFASFLLIVCSRQTIPPELRADIF
jgi:hypothetical protein